MVTLLQPRNCPWATAVRQPLANVGRDDGVVQVPSERRLRHAVLALTGEDKTPVLINVATIPWDSHRIVASLYATHRDERQHERPQEIREEIHETAAHHQGSETAPMPERYAKVDPSTLQERERTGGGAASRDLGGALGAENLTARVWRFGPGHEMAYHRHRAH